MPDVVPGRLFFSRLPAGELEFSASADLTGIAAAGTVSWQLRGAGTGREVLTCERAVRTDERDRGWAVLAAVLPADWPDSVLTVSLDGHSSEHQVSSFRQRQQFGLPFDSDVLVVTGHRIGEPHRSAVQIPSQQFGWDLVPLQRGSLAVFSTTPSQPPRTAEMAGYGRTVLSPAPGVVVAAADGVPDPELLGHRQVPPGASLTWALGNHVIIRHDDDVHSCLAHLRPGTIAVSAGQEIEAGTPVGAVGSSGNASGPHLHLHFMDGPDILAAAPLPVQLTAEGETAAPVSGQILGP